MMGKTRRIKLEQTKYFQMSNISLNLVPYLNRFSAPARSLSSLLISWLSLDRLFCSFPRHVATRGSDPWKHTRQLEAQPKKNNQTNNSIQTRALSRTQRKGRAQPVGGAGQYKAGADARYRAVVNIMSASLRSLGRRLHLKFFRSSRSALGLRKGRGRVTT